MPFGPLFSINFRDHLNCNFFFTISGLPLWHQNQSTSKCCWNPPSWSSFIVILYWFYLKIADLGILSKSSGRPNPQTPTGVRRCQINECRDELESASVRALVGFKWHQMASKVNLSGSSCRPKYLFFDDFGAPFCQTNPAEIYGNFKKCNLRRPSFELWWLVDDIWTSIFDQFSWPPTSFQLQHV